jgi:hypothetical protein
MTLNALETALLDSLHRRESIDWLNDRLTQEGIAVRREGDGEVITDRDHNRRALERAMQQFLRWKLPKLAYLGVVVAAD